MILVILEVCIGLIMGGLLLRWNSPNYRGEELGVVLLAIGSVVGAFVLAFVIYFTCDVVSITPTQQKIAMYTEENTQIEERIANTVAAYKEYEQETFAEFKQDDVMVAVSLYPELKSDTLVQKEIETYINNNNTIKQLKAELIDKSISKWWLYFGGAK